MSFLFVLAAAMSALAAGTISLSGTVRSFSAENFELFDGKRIYTIEKNKLSSSDQAQLTHPKQGQQLSLQVPFAAITSSQASK
jgi:hypothetical protein